MSRKSAVGVLNGNWRNRWRDELLEQQDRKYFIKENNRDKFGEALDALKAADPDWEAWFDNDENIPPYILWTDSELISELCRRMIERMILCQEKQKENQPVM